MKKGVGYFLTTGIAFLFFLRPAVSSLTRVLHGDLGPVSHLVFCFFVLVLLMIRSPAATFSSNPAHWFLAVAGTILTYFTNPSTVSPTIVIWAAYFIQLIGIVLTTVALFYLGGSFGIIAAKRPIKTKGIYQFVRHPMYLGEALWFFSIILIYASVWNIIVYCVQVTCQITRVLEEEKILRNDLTYNAYMQRVRYRLIPGIF